MICYRIECEVCKDGPYNCTCLQWQDKKQVIRDKHSTDRFLRTRPGMYVDFPREHRWNMELYYSGFDSRASMCKWFTKEELRLFHDNGFHLSVWEADDFYIGYSKNQVFFRRTRRISTRRLFLA